MRVTWRRLVILGLTSAALAAVAGGCGGGSSSSTETTAATGGTASVPQIDVTSLGVDFAQMAKLKVYAGNTHPHQAQQPVEFTLPK